MPVPKTPSRVIDFFGELYENARYSLSNYLSRFIRSTSTYKLDTQRLEGLVNEKNQTITSLSSKIEKENQIHTQEISQYKDQNSSLELRVAELNDDLTEKRVQLNRLQRQYQSEFNARGLTEEELRKTILLGTVQGVIYSKEKQQLYSELTEKKNLISYLKETQRKKVTDIKQSFRFLFSHTPVRDSYAMVVDASGKIYLQTPASRKAHGKIEDLNTKDLPDYSRGEQPLDLLQKGESTIAFQNKPYRLKISPITGIGLDNFSLIILEELTFKENLKQNLQTEGKFRAAYHAIRKRLAQELQKQDAKEKEMKSKSK